MVADLVDALGELEREARVSRAPDRGRYRCPEPSCPVTAARTETGLRVLVAHIREHRDVPQVMVRAGVVTFTVLAAHHQGRPAGR